MNYYEKRSQIGIVGMGLMGASLGFALHGFWDATLLGTDVNPIICKEALAAGVVHEVFEDPSTLFSRCDFLIFCIYPHNIPNILEKYSKFLKPDAILSDICGVKEALYREILPIIPESVEYIGLHPMAGKEHDGFKNADRTLYHGCNFIITPTPRSGARSLEFSRNLAKHIGALRIRSASPADHDAVIAYTSDLMHIAASALCMHPHPSTHPAFTAGAFRDCTRIADINSQSWAGLLMDNHENTLAALETFISDLEKVKACLLSGNKDELSHLLELAGEHKRRLQHMQEETL